MSAVSQSVKIRILLVFGMVMLFPLAIGIQMMRIQAFEGAALRSLWDAQAIDAISIPAQRGKILDSRGRILVSNTVTYSIAIDPLVPNTRPAQIDTILTTLSQHTGRPVSEYRHRMRQAPEGSRYIVLERSIPREAYTAVRGLRLRNSILEERYSRRYNYESLAAHILGYVNHEVNGQMGLESFYNNMLRGRDGEQQVQRDRNGRIKQMVGAPRRQPVEGYTLKTTIDAHIQAIVEEELQAGVIRTRARSGTVVVLDPRSGAIRAMANYPTFNPNQLRPEDANFRRNPAIADMIEPGSTFKLVAAVAAVEQNLVVMDEVFVTPENGVRLIHGQAMRDHNPLGTLDFTDVIRKSSNIATAEVAMRLPRETFFQYARNLGFGSHTGIDLTSEEAGRMQRPYQWSNVTLPWMSIGYEVQVTPLQIAMAYGAFANNGTLMKPFIVDEILNERGETIQKSRPVAIRRAIKPETIRILMPAFEGVVTEDGTAVFARIEGITVGGKTGTAQKFIDGMYRNRYRASFVGFYPSNDPHYVVLVMLDEPRTSIYGGFTSGPIFRQITSRIMGLDENLQKDVVEQVNPGLIALMPSLRGLSGSVAGGLLDNLNIRHDSEGQGSVVIAQTPEPGEPLQRRQRVTITLGNQGTADASQTEQRPRGEVPDIRGMSMRRAVLTLTEAGFESQMVGSGTVYRQFPEPGVMYELGREVTARGRSRSMQLTATAVTTGGAP
jgi:cell division protein FtsI/penicillin-binding protein 2